MVVRMKMAVFWVVVPMSHHLLMEAVRTSEVLVNLHRCTHYNPEDGHFLVF
jgi:hypothetical protein